VSTAFRAKESRILIVEDEESVRQVIQRTLEDFGFKTAGASDGEVALKKIEDTSQWGSSGVPDLILSDVMMPRLDGFQLCERVKADPRTRSIPFIFVTVRSGVADRAQGLMLGCQRYLVKPFRKGTLLQAVSQCLVDAGQTRALLAEHSGKVEGDLTQVSIQSLVDQFLGGGRSGTLSMSRRGIEGRVKFEDGRIEEAAWGKAKGQEALTAILCLTEGHFRAERD
jgi:twitching motility two-component system response regulator PilG